MAPALRTLSQEERPESDLTLGDRDENPSGLSLLELLREDLATHDGDLLAQGFWAVAAHRLGNARMRVRPLALRAPLSVAYKALEKLVEMQTGINLKYTVKLGRRVRIWHHGGMILGALEIGDDVHIRQNTTFGVARRGDPRWKKPILEARVDVGAGAVIVGGVRVGHDSVIGAGSVVLRDVPPFSVAVGVPARIVPRRHEVPSEAV